MPNPPKLLIVLVMVIVLIFILGVGLGARIDGPIDTDSLKTAGQSLFGNQPFPVADISVASPSSCRVSTNPATVQFNRDGCVLNLKDSGSAVRRLALGSTVPGQSVGLTLRQDNQITVQKTLPTKSVNSVKLDVFKAGGVLTLTCTPGNRPTATAGQAGAATPTPAPTLAPDTCLLTLG
jgi:hypothetical protein